ncbi:MAG TPA: mannitol dehydrogenase family protein [Solirubrobacteraceae bacterium]|nr:mannitol dehydrogenase family protein [Solirubrobacteraceae bacterium]
MILGRLPAPPYDRAQVTPGVVHIGVGGFHRAHQALFHDRLLERGETAWGLCGMSVLDADRRIQDVLEAQDGLYTLVEKHADGEWDGRVIGSIVAHRFAPADREAAIEVLAGERTKIVSLTITEGGYDLDGAPTTAYELVTEALRRRRDRDEAPFTIMSCDNLEGNGQRARRAFTTFAAREDAGLGDWIGEHVAFPCSMVDRITPVTTDDDRREIEARFGVDDAWPVVCEPFIQWVLEDSFADGRPPYDDVGVQVVDDVEPYELMKLRLLNASHQALAYFGHLAGYALVHDAAQDPAFRRFLLGYMEQEATPTLPPVPGVDVADYRTTLIERFSNPGVRDTIPRLAAESSDRIPKWLLPVIRRRLEDGGEIRRSAAVVASWARYAEGVDEHGEPIEVVDRLAGRLGELARDPDPDAFIRDRELFGELAEDERFAAAYRDARASLRERGARATLESLA